ncbi:DUF3048 domain-containing protein [Candidatus Daviesbacteria bacterium]|nr:DUF3048 domain-containing protein [Candidatus Daviesbacteria bacterium]
MSPITSVFNNLTKIQKYLVIAILVVLMYIATSTISYSLLIKSFVGKQSEDLASSIPTPSSIVEEDPKEPKTEECPLNGRMHTKKAKAAWDLRRPLAIMVENHSEARPQSGLTSADVIYEAVAEGGITRFMAVFLCNLSEVQVGPVRSARTYYLDWLSEYDALYAHVGGANTPGPANALGQIIQFDLKSLNQFGIGYPTYWRDYQRLGKPVATEHTMYSTTKKLWEVGAKKEWTATDSSGLRWDSEFEKWLFKDDSASDASAKLITVNFWEGKGDYQVEWIYDGACNCYKRKNGGADHTDLNNKQQISPKNVVIQFMRESRANDGYEGNVHLLYANKGQGKALILQDGKVIEGQWVKPNRQSREKFIDSEGSEIEFNRGQLWIQTVPEGSKVSY